MKGILGKKIGMTQIFSDGGEIVPVTVVETTPSVVVQKKTVEKDGYNAVQIGFLEKRTSRVTKPLAGHFKKASEKMFYVLKEFRVDDPSKYELGQEVKLSDVFSEGQVIDVTAKSKGKGFQGVMKRHNFKGGRATHGSMFHRAPGSAGSSAYPSRVWKGKRYPGHMGSEQVTVQNLKIAKIVADQNLLLIKGAVPGGVNTVLVINKAKKSI